MNIKDKIDLYLNENEMIAKVIKNKAGLKILVSKEYEDLIDIEDNSFNSFKEAKEYALKKGFTQIIMSKSYDSVIGDV